MTDVDLLTVLNDRFIEACREGSWEALSPILAPSFRYLDGATGELWEVPRYIRDLQESPAPALAIDELVIHVDGDRAAVSARTSIRPGRYNRYVDVYQRIEGNWVCVFACVWPLMDG